MVYSRITHAPFPESLSGNLPSSLEPQGELEVISQTTLPKRDIDHPPLPMKTETNKLLQPLALGTSSC